MAVTETAKKYIGFRKNNVEVVGLGYRDNHGKRQYEVKCHLCGKIYHASASNLNRLKGNGCKSCNKIYLRRVERPVKTERLHSIWQAMRKRCSCTDKNDNHYKNYSGRGIRVCDEWQNSYQAFREWALENGWDESKKLTIDRIDNYGNYCPENCRFATNKEQQNNKRNTPYIEYEGKLYNYGQLCDLLGISKPTLYGRLKSGYTGKELSLKYHKNFKKVNYKGKEYSFSELSNLCGLPAHLIYARVIDCGWTVEEAISTPKGELNHRIKLYEFNGEMLCPTEIAKRCNMNVQTLRYRLKNGCTVEEATAKARKKYHKTRSEK